jgi:diadenosine tetraphosphate (Ap4A) HIT family hydrolase
MGEMFPRSIRNELSYYRYKRTKPVGCVFCVIEPGKSDQVVWQGQHINVLKNKFPYSRWDGRKVTDHLMVVPLKHVTQLNKLSAAAVKELLDIVTDYEDRGYSFYIRSPHNKSRSVAHIHGHLIKLR